MPYRTPIAELRLNKTRKLRGFSFTEILFAVMILGIGFIMVAAMFPVAIRQTEDSTRDTSGAAVARTGAEYMEKVATQTWPVLTSTVPPLPPTTSALAVTVPLYVAPTPTAAVSFITIPGQVWTFHDSRTPANSADNNAALTGTTPNLPDWLWSTVSANQIITDDPRYAWVGMYRRDLIVPVSVITGVPTLGVPVAAPYAQLIMIAVQSRSKPAYDPIADVQHKPAMAPTLATVEPDLLTATLSRSAAGVSTIIFNGNTTGDTNNTNRVGEGAYVVISDDTYGTRDPRHGTFNGRIYRVGVYRGDLGATTWSLIPGNDISVSDVIAMGGSVAAGGSISGTVLMVGRGYDPSWTSPFSQPAVFSGAVQDVAAYSTFVQIAN